MTAVREPSHAELQAPVLTAELARLRALLAPDGDPPAAPVAVPPDSGSESALERLVRVLGLSAFERSLLLLAAGVELDGDLAARVAGLQGSSDPRPTFALALARLAGAHWDALAPGSPLRHWLVLEPGPGPTLASRPLALDERILHHLTGMPATDERLAGIVAPIDQGPPVAPSQAELATELAYTLSGLGDRAVVRLHGQDADARLGVACELGRALGLRPLAVTAAALPPPGPGLARTARLIDRETLLVGGLPIVLTDDAEEGPVSALLGLLRAPLVALAGEHAGTTGTRTLLQREVALPAPAEQRALWSAALGAPLVPPLAAAVEEVAQHYRLGAPAIGAVARELHAGAPTPDAATALRRLCRRRARRGLDGLAEHVDPRARWADLVLPDGHTELLRELARQVRHRTQVYERWGFGERTSRGLGVTALFTGESGTGKTLAAEVLARELELDLYRIDLAATVSKYIGETEKNLRRLFDAAEASGAVLLFDEADALFGKRGEVKDGHDRYANLEVAYLLQRMESYRGLAILTTNLRSSVDRAFLRRLRFVVQFPFPDAAQRAEIWRRAFPPATPLDGIVPERLAQLTVTGGSIRSIALSAAFAAAEDGTAVTRAHVVRGARIEYAKAERTLTDAEAAAI
jgi:vesicle-fusing ATPase